LSLLGVDNVSFEVCAVYWSAICNGNAGHVVHMVG
jgi:hypothetical protein